MIYDLDSHYHIYIFMIKMVLKKLIQKATVNPIHETEAEYTGSFIAFPRQPWLAWSLT